MNTCAILRCRRSVSRGTTQCRTHMKQKADRLFSAYIRRRDGKCMADGEHAGVLQCAHLISRRYLATRWNPANATSLCQGHHMYFTVRPLEWQDYLEKRHRATYQGLRQRALSGERPDLAEVIAYLEAA